MTSKNKIVLVLAIMCFALTAGIFLQVRTVRNYIMTAKGNYQENNLRAEVLKYKERYDALLVQTEKIDEQLKEELEKVTSNNSELEDAKNKITEGNKIIGLSEVTGPGVKIVIQDSEKYTGKEIDASLLLVHDEDIIKTVNELKNAGAEAISINGQRVIITTSIVCGGNIININGERIGSPFEIYAIGLPETLANISRPGGYLSILKDRDIKVTLEKNNNITIPKYSGVLNFKYLTSIN